jgi:outer membrane receptor for ferric coprogen and ferric-rhodotorulic acid
LKLIVGARVSNYEIDNSVGGAAMHYEKNGVLTPYAGLVYDINRIYSAYLSHTRIFNPQTDYQD